MGAQNRIVGIVGRKGSGKSTALHALVSQAPRLLVFDVCGEHRFPPNTLEAIPRLVAFLHWTRGRPVWQARYIPHHDLVEEFNLFAAWTYRYGRLVLAVEEAPMVSQPNWLPPDFDRIVRLGRHRAIDLVWTAQRMSEVARRLTAATDAFVLFAQPEPRDRDALQDRCGVAVAERVSRLGLHDWLGWDVLSRQVLKGLHGLKF